MNFITTQKIKESSFSAIITRADGTIEDLGVISYYSPSLFRRLHFNIYKFFNFKY